jgi:thymidine kinase
MEKKSNPKVMDKVTEAKALLEPGSISKTIYDKMIEATTVRAEPPVEDKRSGTIRSIRPDAGYLEVILGPMFSGKTTRLIEHYKAYKRIGKKIVALNYSLDVRYSTTNLSSHDHVEIPCVFADNLSREKWIDADVILINEGQFFGDLVSSVIEMVEMEHKHVYVCGLDGDFRRCKFGTILDLIPYSDRVEKLRAFCSICLDGTMAVFSHRVSSEKQQVVIGSDNYAPLCRQCYLSNH